MILIAASRDVRIERDASLRIAAINEHYPRPSFMLNMSNRPASRLSSSLVFLDQRRCRCTFSHARTLSPVVLPPFASQFPSQTLHFSDGCSFSSRHPLTCKKSTQSKSADTSSNRNRRSSRRSMDRCLCEAASPPCLDLSLCSSPTLMAPTTIDTDSTQSFHGHISNWPCDPARSARGM